MEAIRSGGALPALAPSVRGAPALGTPGVGLGHDPGVPGTGPAGKEVAVQDSSLISDTDQGLHGDLITPVHGFEDLPAGREGPEDSLDLQIRPWKWW